MFRQSRCLVSCREGWPTGNAGCNHETQSQHYSSAAFVVAAVEVGVAAVVVAELGSRLEWGFAVVAWEEAVGVGWTGSCRSSDPVLAEAGRSELLTAGYLASGEDDAAGVGSVAGA